MRWLDYKQSSRIVGEWVDPSKTVIYNLSDCPDLVAFKLDDWLIEIKPTLKEVSQFYKDVGGK